MRAGGGCFFVGPKRSTGACWAGNFARSSPSTAGSGWREIVRADCATARAGSKDFWRTTRQTDEADPLVGQYFFVDLCGAGGGATRRRRDRARGRAGEGAAALSS